MKLNITVLFIAFLSTLTIAQSKVGTIDSEYVIGLMPESKTVIELTKAYGAKLDSSFSIKVEDFKAKLEDYKLKEKDMGELEKKTIQKELSGLDQDIQKYQKTGNTLMGLRRDELMRPLYTKLSEAISIVSKENGYTQVLTVTGNEFAYIDAKFDITELVLTKLEVVMPEAKQ
jgi:outer membrane protein